jgi:hypothetical protein
MDLAVLKELGGWLHWSSLQFYVQILPETIRRQYQDAYERLANRHTRIPIKC